MKQETYFTFVLKYDETFSPIQYYLTEWILVKVWKLLRHTV